MSPTVAWGQVAKVLRGGSWNNNENSARATNRNNNNPDNQNDNIGFRCAVAVAPGLFLKGQVHRVYGCGASAQGEHSRPGPGWVALFRSTKDTPLPLRPVGMVRTSGWESRWQFSCWVAVAGQLNNELVAVCQLLWFCG